MDIRTPVLDTTIQNAKLIEHGIVRPITRTPILVTQKQPINATRLGRTPITKSCTTPFEKSKFDDLVSRLKAKISSDNPPHEIEPEVIQSNGLGYFFLGKQITPVTTDEIETRLRVTVESEDKPWVSMAENLERLSCAFFAQEVLSGAADYGGRFFVSEHHQEWDHLVNTYKRLCVLAPRDHGKTYFFDFAYPIWKAKTQPGSTGYIFSATSPQAERILEDIKDEIESNPKLQYLIPTKKEKWNARYIRLANNSRIYARSFLTKVRGAHPQWIVVDDGLNDETIYSSLTRQKQIDYFFTAITNMVVPGGSIIVIGTPFHKQDLYSELRENDKYYFVQYKAIKDDGTALWPDRYPLSALQDKKDEIKSLRFTREFMCEPIADDMSLFPSYLFRGDPTEQFNVRLGMDRAWWDEHVGVEVFMAADFAMSSSVQADYMVIFVMGRDKQGNRWLMDIRREKGLPYQEQLSLINSLARKYSPGLIFLEANQMQRIFGDELIRLTDLPIYKYTTGVEKHSLEKGVPSLRVLLENVKFRIPRGDAHSVKITDTWIEEMNSFTWNDGKLCSVSGHDDTVMACWLCEQAIKRGAFDFSFGDEYAGDADNDALMRELLGEESEEQAEGNGQSADPMGFNTGLSLSAVMGKLGGIF